MKKIIKETFDNVFTKYEVPSYAQPYVFAEAMVAIKAAIGEKSAPIPYPLGLGKDEKEALEQLAILGLKDLNDKLPREALTEDVFSFVKELAKEYMLREAANA